MSSIEQLNECGQSVWYDNVDRGLLDSGELKRLIELGVSGVTSNPTIFERAITSSTAYDDEIFAAVQEGKSTQEIYDSLTFADIRRVADLLMPVFESTNHRDGYVSIEVPPNLSHDTENTINEGQRLFRSINKPNVMIKVPATEEGIPAVRELIKDGINVNVTLIFSVKMYEKVVEAYITGLENRLSAGLPLTVASVASFFVSRVDTKVDKIIQEQELDESLLGQAGVANAKVAYKRFEELFFGNRFEQLRTNGGQVQRPLWASTGVKNPHYPELLYVSSLAGPHTVNTMPPKTLNAVLSVSEAFTSTVNSKVQEAEEVLHRLTQDEVSLTNVTDELLVEGLNAFEKSFQTLLQNLKEKSDTLRTR